MAVTQLGARHSYKVAALFASAKVLAEFHTDFWAGATVRALARTTCGAIPSRALELLAGRYHDEVPDALVRSYPRLGLTYALRRVAARNIDERYCAHLWASRAFSNCVARRLGHVDAVYVTKEGPEILARKDIPIRIAEQVDCPLLYWRLRDEEIERWPGWERHRLAPTIRENLEQRDRETVGSASCIVAPSFFVADYLRDLGVSLEKVRVIPYPCRSSMLEQVPRRRRPGPLRVLVAGALSLMKGLPYFLEAVRLLGPAVEARWVGPSMVEPGVVKGWQDRVQFTGHLDRWRMAGQYQWADVLVCPSLCEGSATVVSEALTWGLPVVVTENSGTWIKDQVDGFVVKIRDPEAIAATLERLNSEPGLYEEISISALRHAKMLDGASYRSKMMGLLIGLTARVASLEWA